MARASSGALASAPNPGGDGADGQRNGAPGKGSEATAFGAGFGDRPRVSFELLPVAALLLLTAAFGRTFSKLELGFSWLHPTEAMLIVAFAAALARSSPREWLTRVRRTGVVVALLALWLFGAVAAIRGLADWGFSLVLYDIGLVEYSLLIPLLSLVIRNRLEFVWLCKVVALGGLLAIVVHAVTLWTPQQWDLSGDLNLIMPASGLYAGLYVAWVLAQRAGGAALAPWRYASLLLGVVLIVLGTARAAWVGLLAALLLIVAFATSGTRLALAGTVSGVLAVGFALSIPAGDLQLGHPPGAEAPSESTLVQAGDSSQTDENAARSSAEPTGRSKPAPGGAEPGNLRPPEGPEPRGDRAGGAAEEGGEPSRQRSPADTEGPVSSDSLYENPGIESATTTGYGRFGSNALTTSKRLANTGDYSLKATYEDDPRLVQTTTYLSLAAGVRHSLSAWVYVPKAWDGGAITLSADGTWAGAEEETTNNTTVTKGAWVRLHTELTPESDDLIGAVYIRADSTPSPGKAIFIDDVVVLGPGVDAAGHVTSSRAQQDGAPNAAEELVASFGSSTQAANSQWRLAFWKFMLEESARHPLFGVGFGKPSNFEWQGTLYDRRRGDPADPFDVTGPHNSFVNLLYRTGLPGLLALAVIMVFAVRGLLPLAMRAVGEDRALAVWLLAGLAITTALASFTVALEGPFMGVFFWTLVALALLAPQALAPARSGRPSPGDG